MKTILVKAYTALNLGDDLFLKILVERYPHTKFRIIAPKYYEEYFKIYPNVIITPIYYSNLNRVILKLLAIISKSERIKYLEDMTYKFIKKASQQSDAYMQIGGSIFIQKDTGIGENEKFNALITNALHDKPKFIIGANFGPYSTNSFLEFYKNLFKSYKDICFRERKSKELFQEHNNIRVSPDVVFQLEVPKVNKEVGTIGFSLIDITWRPKLKKYYQDYLEFICKIILKSLEDGKKICLFSFCKNEGDEKMIENVVSNLPSEIRSEIMIHNYDGNINNFLSKYGEMEYMFSTRFHSMILSFLFDQKVCPLVYSEKMINVLNDLNFNEYYYKISDLGNTNYNACVDSLEYYKFKLDHEVIIDSRKCFSEFESFLNS